MTQKTKIQAEAGKQELVITREFDLPVALLFKAYVVPELVEQWMGTKVLKLESKPHGSWQFETTNPQGEVVFRANGVIHECIPDQKITRTFQMEDSPFDVQLEFLEFEALSDTTSRLTMHQVFRSVALRDQLLQLPFAKGLNWAHDRLQEVVSQLIEH
ncbi:ATPase [Siphonobacter sp. BAB-5385]|uniref:SRPBCC family protein n=1 Tax=Siphonobacter sp. BAB-5385 TaxID=1864822 RepID=UPI000B9E1473|nr:SRPBCC domain-containing protein [Siphonobacter sp. BAB-5385]OZI05889.1 ATPase [Siphonobacter sp. BAB-5385]